MTNAMYAAASLYNDPRFLSKSEVRIRANRARRQRIFKMQLSATIVLVTLVLFTVIFMCSSFYSGAQSDKYQPEFKYYTSITVHSGDTLWSIANDNFAKDHYKDLNSYIMEICKLNKMDTDSVLNAGESLIIPYYSTEYK
ncbi:LysM peptidoglycan-binding domain-containing protein [Butyrivibrio sp. VCB2006]|uniref:LysM peptidoglycan-binding domain-containing protein n=1 Tax=Butyrivibrio sp. VCB2006 TaxID=1280679 RepID=UPI0003F9FC97|nr:LysM peptidoglycan-binding domain-containing protein [Butyrivibrio sp. VCB2006]